MPANPPCEPLGWLPDGSPYSPRFGDRYRTRSGGLAQAQQVFLAGCGLPQGWAHQPQCTVLETGFGLGLNFLATWHAWRTDPARCTALHYVAVEAYPVSADDLRRSAEADGLPGDCLDLVDTLASAWAHSLAPPQDWHFEPEPGLRLTLLAGDVRPALQRCAALVPGGVNAVYLDGFAPAVNPAMWSPEVMKAVARLCAPGARAASWCVALPVRAALSAAGFAVRKAPGLPPKRHSLQARLPT